MRTLWSWADVWVVIVCLPAITEHECVLYCVCEVLVVVVQSLSHMDHFLYSCFMDSCHLLISSASIRSLLFGHFIVPMKCLEDLIFVSLWIIERLYSHNVREATFRKIELFIFQLPFLGWNVSCYISEGFKCHNIHPQMHVIDTVYKLLAFMFYFACVCIFIAFTNLALLPILSDTDSDINYK